MSIERRWNRNEVSRESPDKEVNRRPTSLKKFKSRCVEGAKGLSYYYYYYYSVGVPEISIIIIANFWSHIKV